MDNASSEQLRCWVERQVAFLDAPEEWQPDASGALRQFHRRAAAHQTPWPVWVLAAAVSIAAILVMPGPRAIAQQVWQLLTVRRVAFIRVNPWPPGVPSPQVNLIGAPIPFPARDIDEAQRRVGYQPRLPSPSVLAGDPQIYTTFSVSAGTVVKAADLRLALQKAGVTDQTVPPEWDGAQLALHTSQVVIAQWPQVVLAQSLPLTLTAPANFNFPAFSGLILRVLGVAPDQAAALAQQMGTAPPWLAPISRDLDANATFESIPLKSGPATLLQQTGGLTLTWSAPIGSLC